MATITKGITFASGDVVTPTKLNNLVDAATVTNIVNADISASAAITDTKLATISTSGKVANSATTASSSNTANSIVARDASGNFSAGTITASLSGNSSTASAWAAARSLSITGDVTATLSVNGSANVSAAATISNNSVTTAKIADANVTTAKIANGAVTSAKLGSDIILVPAGAVLPFAMNSAPSGWLAANGAAVSRTAYAGLFTAIGTTYGTGDGSTTFNLPDLRGYFVRGAGTNSDDTAAGTFGAKQPDDFKSHSHFAVANSPGTGGVNSSTSLASTFDFGDRHSYILRGTSINSNVGLTSWTGSTETRPKNIALLYCIKF